MCFHLRSLGRVMCSNPWRRRCSHASSPSLIASCFPLSEFLRSCTKDSFDVAWNQTCSGHIWNPYLFIFLDPAGSFPWKPLTLMTPPATWNSTKARSRTQAAQALLFSVSAIVSTSAFCVLTFSLPSTGP